MTMESVGGLALGVARPSTIRGLIAVSLTIVTGVALLVAPPAAADRYTELDPAGDMKVQARQTGELSPAPIHRTLDIRNVIVRHTDHFVSIRAVTRSLTRPRSNEKFNLFGFVKVNRRAQPSESVAWTWEVEFDERRPRSGDRLFIMDATHQEEFGCDGFRDKGLKARANYDRHWVTVVIPRRCLALDHLPNVRPRWVQVSVEAVHSFGRRRDYLDFLGSQVRKPFPNLGNSHFTPRLFPG